MTPRAAILVLLLTLCAGASPVLAQSACAPMALPEADIAVETMTTPAPPIDRSLGVLELGRMARERLPQSKIAGRVLGLTVLDDLNVRLDEFRLVLQVGQGQAGQGQAGEGQVCSAPGRIRIAIHPLQRIYVVRSAAAGSCWERAIIAHEMQHVGFNNEAAVAAGQRIEARLRSLATQPALTTTAMAARQSWTIAANRVLAEELDAAFAEARRKHAAIDGAKAYLEANAKMRHDCGV